MPGEMQYQQRFQRLWHKPATVSHTGYYPCNPYSFWLSAVLYKKKTRKNFVAIKTVYFVGH